jgi:GDP-mannose 6-dehydrogenase
MEKLVALMYQAQGNLATFAFGTQGARLFRSSHTFPMNLSIFGLGYVGTVLAGCFAQAGHRVIGVDPEAAKVDLINSGRSPIVEAEIEGLLRDAVKAGNLRATGDVRAAVMESEISLICVGTPSRQGGELDLTYVRRVSTEIGIVLQEKAARHVVVVRSTVLPGTIEEEVVPAMEEASGKRFGRDFGVVMNPEFMRESSAVRDFYEPPKTVIGAADARDGALVAQLYAGLPGPVIHTAIRTAEMVKYADNLWHAAKVTFANEIGLLAKSLGVDGRAVMEIFCQDTKLNLSPAYLRPGFAYGGSCLPKDLRAMTWAGRSREVETPMLANISVSNEAQIRNAVRIITAAGRPRVGVLGFAFKGGTDDLRESPVVTVAEALLGKGCELKLYDPFVNTARLVGSNRRYIEQHLPHLERLMVESAAEAVAEADVVLLGNKAAADAAVLGALTPEQWVLDLTSSAAMPATPAKNERIAS